jgi:peptidoglycan/xylan/chitin deacetylase (PgdA/CDA1 family)
MKTLIIKIFYATAYYSCLLRFFYFLNRKRQVILTYHNIIPDQHFSDLPHLGVSTSSSAFHNQIRIILKRFKTTTEIGVPNSCMITFDDGYRNNLTVAASVLKKKKIQCVFFVPACYFNEENKIWVDQILMWVSYVPQGEYNILGNVFLIDSIQSRHKLWQNIFEKIINNFSLLNSLHNSLIAQYPINEIKNKVDPELYNLRFEGMSIKELTEMKNMGQLIACHSLKHDILSKLNKLELKNDFESCDHVKHMYNSNYYAYPFGGNTEVSDEVIEMCKEYSYSAAFSNFDSNTSNVYFLGRISLDNLSNKYHIEARLSGFEKFLKSFLI